LGSCWANWCRRRTASGSPTRRRAAQTDTHSAPAGSMSVTKPASVTAAATRLGPAARAIRRCSGRHSTLTVPHWMGRRSCASPPNQAEQKPEPAPPFGRAVVVGGGEVLDPRGALVPLRLGPFRVRDAVWLAILPRRLLPSVMRYRSHGMHCSITVFEKNHSPAKARPEQMNGYGPSSRSGRLLRLLSLSPCRREGHRGRRAETASLRKGGTERGEGRC
jgi:hypothetical protein